MKDYAVRVGEWRTLVEKCRDAQLSAILKCSEWTSREIQLRIDEYQRDLRASTIPYNVPQLKSHPAAKLGDESSICDLSD